MATWFVDSSMSVSGNGTSWATAWKNISNIVNASLSPGDFIYFSGGPTNSSQTYVTPAGGWFPKGGSNAGIITYSVGQDSQHNGLVIITNTNAEFCINLSNCAGYIKFSGYYGVNFDCMTPSPAPFTVVADNPRHCTVNATAAQHMQFNSWGNTAGTNNTGGPQSWEACVYSDPTGVQPNMTFSYIVAPAHYRFLRLTHNADGTTGLTLDHIASCKVFVGNNQAFDDTFLLEGVGNTGAYGGGCVMNDNYLMSPANPATQFADDIIKWGDSYDFIHNHTIIYIDTTYGADFTFQHGDIHQGNPNFTRCFNNWYENIGESVFFFDDESGGGTYNGFQFYNNLITVGGFAQNARGIDFSPNIKTATHYNNVMICNNTWVGIVNSPVLRMGASGFPSTWTNCVIANNLGFACNVDSGAADWDPNAITSIPVQNSVQASTLADFVNGSGVTWGGTFLGGTVTYADFALKLGAPEIAAGRQENALFTTDALGITRGASWDVGAFEYNGVVIPQARIAAGIGVLATGTQISGGPAGIPGPVQHVAFGMERNPIGTFNFTYPNRVKQGNCLVVGIQFSALGAFSSISDTQGNLWIAGPTNTNATPYATQKLFYCYAKASGIDSVTITLTGLAGSTAHAKAHAVISEFYNVGVVDVSSSSSVTAFPPAMTTTAPGDLVYHWAIDGQDSNANGGNYNATTPFVPGVGWNLLSGDLQVGSVDQFIVQSAAGSIGPVFTGKVGTAVWQSVAIAFKAANAGTPPSGCYIANAQHTLLTSVAQGRTSGNNIPAVSQLPSIGNLLVVLFDSDDVQVNSMSDSKGNNYISAGISFVPGTFNVLSQILYAQNAHTGRDLTGITFVYNGTTTSDQIVIIYDVVGAATPIAFDNWIQNSGTQTVAGDLNLNPTPLVPSTPDGITFISDSHDFCSMSGVLGAGYIFDCAWNNLNNNANPIPPGTPTSTLDEDNFKGHIFNNSLAAVAFIAQHVAGGSTPVNHWSSVTAHFKAAAAGGTSTGPTAMKTSLVSTARVIRGAVAQLK